MDVFINNIRLSLDKLYRDYLSRDLLLVNLDTHNNTLKSRNTRVKYNWNYWKA